MTTTPTATPHVTGTVTNVAAVFYTTMSAPGTTRLTSPVLPLPANTRVTGYMDTEGAIVRFTDDPLPSLQLLLNALGRTSDSATRPPLDPRCARCGEAEHPMEPCTRR